MQRYQFNGRKGTALRELDVFEDQWRTEGSFGGFKPPPEIPKTLQNRDKLNPIVKNVKNRLI